eukprot:UN01654
MMTFLLYFNQTIINQRFQKSYIEKKTESIQKKWKTQKRIVHKINIAKMVKDNQIMVIYVKNAVCCSRYCYCTLTGILTLP